MDGYDANPVLGPLVLARGIAIDIGGGDYPDEFPFIFENNLV